MVSYENLELLKFSLKNFIIELKESVDFKKLKLKKKIKVFN